MKYPSTLLAQSATPQEIQKADLDLLKKINEVDALTEANATKQAIVDASLSSQINDVNIIAHPVSDIGRLTEISGDGLSTQYLHDKSGNVIWTNNGLTEVDGYRGKGLLCNGSGYAVANSPVIGIAGTIAIKFKRNILGTAQTFLTNTFAATGGLYILLTTSNDIKMGISNGTSITEYLLATIADANIHTLIVRSNGYIYIDGSLTTGIPTTWVQGASNLSVAGFGAANYFSGTLYNFKAWNRVLSDDECISWANDPAGVDSNVAGIIERGSNANGSWTKFPDGTLICSWVDSVYRTTSNADLPDYFYQQIIVYPYPFISAPRVTSALVLINGLCFCQALEGDGTGTTLFTRGSTAGRTAYPGYVAYGRWK